MTSKECEQQEWPHSRQCRYTDGFFCYDCNTFFPAASPTYRRHEEIGTLNMVIHNIGAACHREKKPRPPEINVFHDRAEHKAVLAMTDEEVEALIADQLVFIHAQGETADSATVVLH